MLVASSTVTLGVTGALGATSPTAAQTGTWEPAPSDYPTIDLTSEMPSTSGSFPAEADEFVIYVHGWQEADSGGGENQGYTLEMALAQTGYDVPTVTAMWDSNTAPLATDVAQEEANVAGPRLAAWLDDFMADNPDTTIRVVTHSLGAQVILSCLNELAGNQVLPDVAMLGGAVDDDAVCVDGEYGDGIANGAETVHSHHSANDSVICSMYQFLESASGLGCAGSDCGGLFSDGETPANFSDNDVTDTVDAHADYGRLDDSCIPLVVENFDAEADGDENRSGWFDWF